MRLALLIVLAAAVVAGAAGSYYHFQSWRESRYDDLIIEAAKDHNVDPALVKALVKARSDFNPGARGEGDSRGLMLVPPEVASAYLLAHGRESWGYICPNWRFRNHDPRKPERFTSDTPTQCAVCKAPLIEELSDPATNIEVGCWYLGRESRYDKLIVETARRYDVDPLLVKALIKVQTDFNVAAEVQDSKGLLLVSPRVASAYLEAHGRKQWGYVCVNRHLPDHDPSKPEQFTSDTPGRCRAAGCNLVLIEELKDPATNIEVACWYLHQARLALQGSGSSATRQVPPHLLVIAYRWGLPERGEQVTLGEEQNAFLARLGSAYEAYRKEFDTGNRPGAPILEGF